MADDAAGDMAVLFPDFSATVKGETMQVSPLFFGQYPKAVKLFTPVFEAVRHTGIFWARATDDEGKKGVAFGIADDWLTRLPVLMNEGGEPLMEFVAFCVGKPRAWLDTVPGDEGFALAKTVFDANIDFFNRRILPILQKMGVAANPQADGAPSSPDSSTPSTDGTTSSATP